MLVYENKDCKYTNIKEVAKVYFKISDRLLIKLKKNERIFLNEEKAYINAKIEKNDIIKFDIDFEEESENIVATSGKLDILFEDEYLLIVNKTFDMPVHPSILHYENSLSNIVRYYFDSKNIKKKIRPVNRLDKDTSRNCYICQKRIYTRMLSKTNENQYF